MKKMLMRESEIWKSASGTPEQGVKDLHPNMASEIPNEGLTTNDLLLRAPLSDRIVLNGVAYEWEAVSRADGLFRLSIDGADLKDTPFEDFPTPLKDDVLNKAASKVIIPAIERHIGQHIESIHKDEYVEAWIVLHTDGNAFLKQCVGLVMDYHALDAELIQMIFLGMSRARYSSVSALAHFDCTGESGAGKNDLVSNIIACVPRQYVDLFSTVSPTALQDHTLKRETDRRGNVTTQTDKNRFSGKIVCITEVADAAGFPALKALAETDEAADFTHSATVNGEAIDMTITGARCVITTSVEGVKDTQVKRRFIHASVSADSLENKLEKLALIEEILVEQKDIRNDPRVTMIRAGLDILFSTHDVEFRPIQKEALNLLKYLDHVFLNAGYSLTNIKQFFTLAECSALWNRFVRGYCRIEVEDVQVAWYLLSNFERETITKTTNHGIATLRAIKELCDAYDQEFKENRENPSYDYDKMQGVSLWDEPKRPTRADIVKAIDVPQPTVYRLLQLSSKKDNTQGELLELGYVTSESQNNKTVYQLTALGQTVLTEVATEAVIDGVTYTSIEPLEVPDVEPLSARQIIRFLTDSQEDEKFDS